jgi:hypothetical protein
MLKSSLMNKPQQKKSSQATKERFYTKIIADFRATKLYSEAFLKDLDHGMRNSDYYEAYTNGELRTTDF